MRSLAFCLACGLLGLSALADGNEAQVETELARAAETLERQVETFLDTNGVLRCAFHPSDLSVWEKVAPYENAGMVQGGFLSAMCAKCRVTGDPSARAKARRTFGAIVRIYRLSQSVEEGFFCKPWDWKVQTATSSDQFIYAMTALDEYAPLAASAERARLSEMIVKMARWWIRHDYRWPYFGKPLAWQCCRFLSFAALGEKYAKDGSFARELQRLLADPSVTADYPFSCQPGRFMITSPAGKKIACVWPETAESGYLSVAAVLEADPANAYARKVMRGCFDLATAVLAAEGGGRRFLVRAPDGRWGDMAAADSYVAPEGGDARYDALIMRFVGPYTVDAANAVVALVQMAKRYEPAAEWVRRECPATLLRMARRGFGVRDPHGVLPKELKTQLAAMSEHSEERVAWLRAYWLWRELTRSKEVK